MTNKEISERVLKNEGILGVLKNPLQFSKEYGSEKERKEAIKEAEYTEEEAGAFTIGEMINHYTEIVKSSMNKKTWDWLSYYIDIEGMICSDYMGGYLTYVVLKNGNIYFIREQ